MPPIVPIKQDAFLLLSDYIQNIKQPTSSWKEKDGVLWQEKNNKDYIFMFIKMDYTSIYELIEQINFIEQQSDQTFTYPAPPFTPSVCLNKPKKTYPLYPYWPF